MKHTTQNLPRRREPGIIRQAAEGAILLIAGVVVIAVGLLAALHLIGGGL